MQNGAEARRGPAARAWLAVPIVCFAVLAGACARGDGKQGKAGDEEEAAPTPVEIAGATRGDVYAVYSGTATFEAEADALVIAKVGGEVEQILVEEGDRVTEGDVLARLDGDRLRLELQRARATLDKLQRDYDRNLELQRKGLVSNESVERLKYDLDAQKADLDLAALELSYTQIRAPISGVVSERQIKVGNTIASGTPAFRVTDLEPLIAYLFVPEREFNKLQPGQTADISIDALGGHRYTGTIARISPVVDAGTGTFKVTVEANDSSGRLKPGMFGRFDIVYDVHRDAVLVPRVAILDDEGESAVFIVEDGLARRRIVSTGLANGSLMEITAGLAGDEQVVVIGQAGLKDGGRVQIVGEPADAGAEAVAAQAAEHVAES